MVFKDASLSLQEQWFWRISNFRKKRKMSRSILHTDFVKYFPNFLITCIEVKTFALKKSSEIVEALLLKSKCITDWGFGKS